MREIKALLAESRRLAGEVETWKAHHQLQGEAHLVETRRMLAELDAVEAERDRLAGEVAHLQQQKAKQGERALTAEALVAELQANIRAAEAEVTRLQQTLTAAQEAQRRAFEAGWNQRDDYDPIPLPEGSLDAAVFAAGYRSGADWGVTLNEAFIAYRASVPASSQSTPHNPPAEWAMVTATLDARDAGITPEDLRAAARVATVDQTK